MENLYEKIGEENIKVLVDDFYDLAFQDPTIKDLFKTNKNTIKQKQLLFLTQFLGGPDLYSREYGHPRLRARHLPHPITKDHAIAWLKCMHSAIQKLPVQDDLKVSLFERFPNTAFFMVNKTEE